MAKYASAHFALWITTDDSPWPSQGSTRPKHTTVFLTFAPFLVNSARRHLKTLQQLPTWKLL